MFLQRHREVTTRISQNLTLARASVSEENLRRWFGEITDYINEHNYGNIFKDPKRVFNADETAFFLMPKGKKVLVQKGSKTVYNRIANDEKECLTTLVTANAAGMLAPPMVVFPYERLPGTISMLMPDGWSIGKSETGWMTSQTFYEYVANVMHPWIVKNQIPLPVVFFVDGHSSHLTLPLSNFCTDNGIILIALYPNSTHILQPMDVAVLHPLKSGWKTAVYNWMTKNSGKN